VQIDANQIDKHRKRFDLYKLKLRLTQIMKMKEENDDFDEKDNRIMIDSFFNEKLFLNFYPFFSLRFI